VPAWLARLIAGGTAVRFFTASTRTTNARLRRDFAWTPQYPTYREGLDQIFAAWKTKDSSKAT
jgi:hypothetical protein